MSSVVQKLIYFTTKNLPNTEEMSLSSSTYQNYPNELWKLRQLAKTLFVVVEKCYLSTGIFTLYCQVGWCASSLWKEMKGKNKTKIRICALLCSLNLLWTQSRKI